jgi:hypothetical protein
LAGTLSKVCYKVSERKDRKKVNYLELDRPEGLTRKSCRGRKITRIMIIEKILSFRTYNFLF